MAIYKDGRIGRPPPASPSPPPPRPVKVSPGKPVMDPKAFEALAALAVATAKGLAAYDLLEGADLSGVLDRETVQGKDIPHA